MSRWVIASRRQRTLEARRASAKRTEEAFKKLFDGSSRVRGIHRGGDERDYFAVVFDADPSETRLKKRFLPREDAILEPEILHSPASVAPRAPRALRVLGDGGEPLNARVTLLGPSNEGGAHAFEAEARRTEMRAAAHASAEAGARGSDMRSAARAAATAALIEPSSDYWSMRVPDIHAIDEDVHLDPLPPGPFGWWHTAMGVRSTARVAAAGGHPSDAAGGRPSGAAAGRTSGAAGGRVSGAVSASARDGDWMAGTTWATSPSGARIASGERPVSGERFAWGERSVSSDEQIASAGEPIAVGVIDTGCGPHAALWHVVDHGAYVQGVYSADGRDSGQHGTHLCGLIGARACPDKPSGYLGVAPDAAIHSVRVCAIGQMTATQVDIALALRCLINVPVHLVTIGLCAAESSQIVAEAIRDAMEAGILCICPAGNTASRVRFPAALDDTAAVTAIGMTGWGPPRARVHDFEPPSSARSRFGTLDDDEGDGATGAGGLNGLYVASFSCVAPTPVTCGGPGVGIISCVPGEDGTAYAEMSGHVDGGGTGDGRAGVDPVGEGELSHATARARARGLRTCAAGRALSIDGHRPAVSGAWAAAGHGVLKGVVRLPDLSEMSAW